MTSETYSSESHHHQEQAGQCHGKRSPKGHQLWYRLPFMLLFAVALHLCGMVMWLICVVQFVIVLAYGDKNANLTAFSESLVSYISQALKYVSFNSEEKPFPFASWPTPPVETVNEKKGEDVSSNEKVAEVNTSASADSGTGNSSSGNNSPGNSSTGNSNTDIDTEDKTDRPHA